MGSRLTQNEILKALSVRCKERGQRHTFAIEYYNNANDSAIQVNCLEHNRSEVRTYRPLHGFQVRDAVLCHGGHTTVYHSCKAAAGVRATRCCCWQRHVATPCQKSASGTGLILPLLSPAKGTIPAIKGYTTSITHQQTQPMVCLAMHIQSVYNHEEARKRESRFLTGC